MIHVITINLNKKLNQPANSYNQQKIKNTKKVKKIQKKTKKKFSIQENNKKKNNNKS